MPEVEIAERIARRRDREATKARILISAERRFAAQGFERATTKQIAQDAECSEALIANYFDGKPGLILSLGEIRAREAEEFSDEFILTPVKVGLYDEIYGEIEHLNAQMEKFEASIRAFLPASIYDPSLSPIVGSLTGQSRVPDQLIPRLESAHRWKDHHLVPPAARVIAAIALQRFLEKNGLVFSRKTPLDLNDEVAILIKTIETAW